MRQVIVTYTDGGRDVWDGARAGLRGDRDGWLAIIRGGVIVGFVPREAIRKVEERAV